MNYPVRKGHRENKQKIPKNTITSRSSLILLGLLGSSLQNTTNHSEIGLCCACINRIFICFFFLVFVRLYPGRWVLLQNMHGYTRLQHGGTYTGYPHARQLERTLIRFSTIARMVSWPWCSLSGHQHTEDAAAKDLGVVNKATLSFYPHGVKILRSRWALCPLPKSYCNSYESALR